MSFILPLHSSRSYTHCIHTLGLFIHLFCTLESCTLVFTFLYLFDGNDTSSPANALLCMNLPTYNMVSLGGWF